MEKMIVTSVVWLRPRPLAGARNGKIHAFTPGRVKSLCSYYYPTYHGEPLPEVPPGERSSQCARCTFVMEKNS